MPRHCFDEPGWIGLAARAYDFIVATAICRRGGAQRASRIAGAPACWSSPASRSIMPPCCAPRWRCTRRATARAEPALARDYLADAIGFAEALASALRRSAHRAAVHGGGATPATSFCGLAPTADDAIPNAHPVALDGAGAGFAAQTGDPRWLKQADALFQAVAPALRGNPVGHAGVLNALDVRLRAKEIATVGTGAGGALRGGAGRSFSATASSSISTGRRRCRKTTRPAHRRGRGARRSGRGGSSSAREGACAAAGAGRRGAGRADCGGIGGVKRPGCAHLHWIFVESLGIAHDDALDSPRCHPDNWHKCGHAVMTISADVAAMPRWFCVRMRDEVSSYKMIGDGVADRKRNEA